MTVEAATYISELVPANPDGSVVEVNELDNHDRLIKSVLQAQFPNFTPAAMTATVAELNILDGATVTTAELNALAGSGIVAADVAAIAGIAALGVSTTELGYLNGVTSAIQTQLNARQPLDSDLTAIAALSTTSFGRDFLIQANAAAALSKVGGAAASHNHNASDINAGTLPAARGGTGVTSLAALREALGVFSGWVDDNVSSEDLPAGWSVSYTPTGLYTITHNLGLSDVDKFNVTATCVDGSGRTARALNKGANSFQIATYDASAALTAANFDFVAIDRN